MTDSSVVRREPMRQLLQLSLSRRTTLDAELREHSSSEEAEASEQRRHTTEVADDVAHHHLVRIAHRHSRNRVLERLARRALLRAAQLLDRDRHEGQRVSKTLIHVADRTPTVGNVAPELTLEHLDARSR